jgi:hypothetical protein
MEKEWFDMSISAIKLPKKNNNQLIKELKILSKKNGVTLEHFIIKVLEMSPSGIYAINSMSVKPKRKTLEKLIFAGVSKAVVCSLSKQSDITDGDIGWIENWRQKARERVRLGMYFHNESIS